MLFYVVSFQVVLSEARAGVQQQYGTIREALEQEEQTALECVTKEESRVLGGLEEKLGYLQSSLQSIQQGLHTLEGLADAKGDKRIQDQLFIMVCWISGETPVCLFVCLLVKYKIYCWLMNTNTRKCVFLFSHVTGIQQGRPTVSHFF